MTNRTSPWKSYQQIATQTAPPGQLVLMLYDGAIRFLDRALAGFSHEDPLLFNETISNNILRTQQIVSELNNSLNMQQGGEFANNMRRLYNYFDWRLQQSNLRKEESGIHEIKGRLTILREAWAQMLEQQGQRESTPAEQTVLLAQG